RSSAASSGSSTTSAPTARGGRACSSCSSSTSSPSRRTTRSRSAPMRGRCAALDKGLRWLCTTEMPKRGNDWDIDCSWSALCGFDACVRAALDPRFKRGQEGKAGELAELIHQRGKLFYKLLEQNQEPLGGWGYYEGPVVSHRPTWSTSFS